MDEPLMLQPKPRSVRNANPGNLRKGNIHWAGLAYEQNDPDFLQFRTAAYGFRALAVDLRTAASEGFDTIGKLIPHYAPKADNNPTEAYIKNVCDGTGIAADTKLDLSNPVQLTALCRAIAIQEGQGWHFDVLDLKAGVDMALHPDIA